MYPSFRYHRTEEPKIIHGPEAEHEDWLGSPADFVDFDDDPEPEPILLTEKPLKTRRAAR